MASWSWKRFLKKSSISKQEIDHKQTFMMDADEPAILAGNDEGVNPVEHLLHPLASCLTTSMVAHAAVRGIEIEELESELQGEIDLRSFLGLATDVPKGYTDIRVRFRVKAKPEDGTWRRRRRRMSRQVAMRLHRDPLRELA